MGVGGGEGFRGVLVSEEVDWGGTRGGWDKGKLQLESQEGLRGVSKVVQFV